MHRKFVWVYLAIDLFLQSKCCCGAPKTDALCNIVSFRCALSSVSFQFSDEIQSSLRRIQFSTFDISTFIYTEHNTIERESMSCLYPVIKGMFYVEAGDVNGTGSGSGSRLGPGAPSCGKTLKAVTAPSSIEVDNR